MASPLDTYAIPVMGRVPVADITVDDVLKVLQPIWAEKMETATKLRGCLEEIIAPAIVVGHRADNTNPARWKGNPSAALPKPGEVMKVTNHPANALDDAAPWFAALRRRGGIAARALEFLAITAARSGEVRGAVWDEFDLEAATWTIPAERMKTGREHRVRLSPAAVSIVRAMPEATASRYVFSAQRGGQLSWMTISAVMRRMHRSIGSC